MNNKTARFLDRNFPVLIYIFSLVCLLYILFTARSNGLLPMPESGTDQLGMLMAARDMYLGKLPDAGYMYSPIYTAWLFILIVLSHGNLVIMRTLQAILCALIPVIIYRLTRRLRLGRGAAQLAALFYCFYGPAQLVALDFLRAGPLALCSVVMVFLLITAYIERADAKYVLAGIAAGICILGRENYIPVVLAPLLLLYFKDIRKHVKVVFPMYYFAGVLVIVLPIMVYNLVQFGSFSIIPGHVTNVLGAYHGEEATMDKLGAIVSILANLPTQIFNFISSYEIPNSLSFYAHRDVLDFLRIFIIPFNLLVALGSGAIALKYRNRGILLVLLVVLVYAGSMLPFHIFYRFRIPVVPLLCPLAGAGLIAIYHDFKAKKWFMASAVTVLVLSIFCLTWVNPDNKRSAQEQQAVATHLIRSDRFAAAERYLDSMRKRHVPTGGLERYLIEQVVKSGYPELAESLLRKWFVPSSTDRP